jgi:hypothetical protein
VDDFYAARTANMAALPWSNFAPPFSDVGGAEESNDKPANSDFIIADLLFASEVNNGANARRPDGFAAGGCAQFGADGRLGAHVPFSLNRLGFRISLSLIGASKCG